MYQTFTARPAGRRRWGLVSVALLALLMLSAPTLLAGPGSGVADAAPPAHANKGGGKSDGGEKCHPKRGCPEDDGAPASEEDPSAGDPGGEGGGDDGTDDGNEEPGGGDESSGEVDVGEDPDSEAPDSQGTWTSPEGVTIEVDSSGDWTIRDIYGILVDNAAAPGDFATIAPTLTVKVQDVYPSMVQTSASTSGGRYTSFRATMYLQGVGSTFAARPDFIVGHEYGHVWTYFHLFMSQNGDWSGYLATRWASDDGAVRLAGDARLDGSYVWMRHEIIAEDYRILFGSDASRADRSSHMNGDIPDPRLQPGLGDYLLGTFAGG